MFKIEKLIVPSVSEDMEELSYIFEGSVKSTILENSLVVSLKVKQGTSLVVQWLRFCNPNAGVLGSIPGQGTRSHMPRLRPGAANFFSNETNYYHMTYLFHPYVFTKDKWKYSVQKYLYVNVYNSFFYITVKKTNIH